MQTPSNSITERGPKLPGGETSLWLLLAMWLGASWISYALFLHM